MANQYDEYDDDNDEFDLEGPANLRKALKKAEKQRKELEEQLSSLKSNLRDRSVKDVLETKGINAKIAAFIPKEIDTPEQIASWLTEYADVFGFQAEQPSNDQPLSENAVASQRIDNAVSGATTPSGDDDIMARLASASTKEELDQLIFGKTMGR
jgi:hypothetical protein